MSEGIVESIREQLFEKRDLVYRDFQSKLIPNIPSDSIIGVRTPELKEMVKVLCKDPEIDYFMQDLPHMYYEENQIHAFLISGMKDFDECIMKMEEFLPYVNNWSTSDQMCPKVFAKKKELLLPYIKSWLSSGKTYHIRFAVGMLMTHFLDERFDVEYAEMVADIKSEEYYVNMMCAWYFATALAKQYDDILPFIENKRCDVWVHNKAIQKAIESRRISDDTKYKLRQYKIK